MEPQQKSNGALIGAFIIIIILILGGIYFWNANIKNLKDEPPVIDTQVNEADPYNTADLEAGIDSIDLEGLDAEI